jgi:hypothetical protein
MDNLPKILTVCANGDSEKNLNDTKDVIGYLVNDNKIDNIAYEYHSINPVPMAEENRKYTVHYNRPFGKKAEDTKYKVIIFQDCNCLYDPVQVEGVERMLARINESRLRQGLPIRELNPVYQSPFQYENIAGNIYNSLTPDGLFINNQLSYSSGTYRNRTDNRPKINEKFKLLDKRKITHKGPNEGTRDVVYDIWGKRVL